MDFDLEIISEEGDRPDPLFDSIMTAMNSMKEATADKIYQKIQKEGATNYSKPQVDRALASALKYGIFEVRNNRYRIRDDVLDDEDTVYWKLQKKRDQTPFRIQEDINDRQQGPRLDPERDNQRFKKPTKEEGCPHCGRTKRPERHGDRSEKKKKVSKKASPKRKMKKERHRNDSNHESSSLRRLLDKDNKRKEHPDMGEIKPIKKRKSNLMKESKKSESLEFCGDEKTVDEKNSMSVEGTSESSESEMEVVPVTGNTLKCFKDKTKTKIQNQNREPRSAFSSECIKTDLDVLKSRRSSISVKTESESEKTYMSSASDDQSQTRTSDGFFEERPCTSRNTNDKIRSQYLHSGEMYRNQYERGQTDRAKGNTDWLGCSDEPQGAVIQSNNVLTIEPMDSLPFKNPEPASYIS